MNDLGAMCQGYCHFNAVFGTQIKLKQRETGLDLQNRQRSYLYKIEITYLVINNAGA